jgi:hypothetical protein
MAASSTCAAFVVALKAALVTRFAGAPWNGSVRVDLIPTGDTSAIDAVTMIRGQITGGQEPATFGNRRQDSYEIPGVIFTYDTGADSDVAFQGSWDKAALILDEVVLQLRDNKTLADTDETKKGRVTSISYLPQVREQGGRVTRCEYTIEYGGIVS